MEYDKRSIHTWDRISDASFNIDDSCYFKQVDNFFREVYLSKKTNESPNDYFFDKFQTDAIFAMIEILNER